MTSAPGGTVKRNVSAATGALAAKRVEAQQRLLAEAVDDLERGELACR